MIRRGSSQAGRVAAQRPDQVEAGADRRERVAQLVGEGGEEGVLAAIGLLARPPRPVATR
jgi:hypothetical protein